MNVSTRGNQRHTRQEPKEKSIWTMRHLEFSTDYPKEETKMKNQRKRVTERSDNGGGGSREAGGWGNPTLGSEICY